MIRHFLLSVANCVASGHIQGQILEAPGAALETEWSMLMISFTLRCTKDHEFEGWFKDSATFEAQQKGQEIECPVCGSHGIEKALSRPNISSGKTQGAAQAEILRKTRESLREIRQKIESTHENVGDRFAEEARKIHYGESETRGIYGETTGVEARELIEEGIPVAPIPWIEEAKDN